MNNVLISCKKELRSIFRDKKFLTIILFMPLIIPVFIIAMGHLYDTLDSPDELKVGFNYVLSDEETNILKSLDNNIGIYHDSDSELEKQYKNGDYTGYVLRKDGVYYLYIDTSSTSGMSLQTILNNFYERYNNYLASNYLTGMGIEPANVFNIVKVELKEQAKEGTNFFTNYILSFALIYLVMIIVITAMNTSTDIIAGEKERGTFETLLTFPLTSNEIIGGKLLAIVISCITSSIIGICTSIPAFYYIKNNTETFKDLAFNISSDTVLLSLMTVILTSALVGVVAIFLCGKAKTFKEAQSKVSFLSFVSLIPMFTNLAGVENKVLYLIPIANGGQMLEDIFMNGILKENIYMFVGSSLVVTILLLLYVSKQYKDEKALF